MGWSCHCMSLDLYLNFFQYWERKEKYSDWMLREGCDDKCLKENFCDIVTMVHGDNRKCEELFKL